MSKGITSYQRDPVVSKPCPSCNESIGYYWFSGMGDMAPHFYCDRCSNIFFNKGDRDLVWGREQTHELLDEIESTLPACPCGGQFRSGQNPKCPHCGYEFKHQDDPVRRLKDPYAILVEGASVISED